MRVGTHALKAGGSTKLWGRLSTHRGQLRNGGGNHRGSIFRLIVGTALIARDGHNVPTWGEGSSATKHIRAAEVELERAVSQVIGKMPFLWLSNLLRIDVFFRSKLTRAILSPGFGEVDEERKGEADRET